MGRKLGENKDKAKGRKAKEEISARKHEEKRAEDASNQYGSKSHRERGTR